MPEEMHRVSARDEVLLAAREAAAVVAYPDFTETWRRKGEIPARVKECQASDCYRPLPLGVRSDREFCCEACRHRERRRKKKGRANA